MLAFGEELFMYGQFFLLFALIIVGYYSNKKGWLDRQLLEGKQHL